MNISPEVLSLIAGIKNDRTHGASELARQAMGVLRISAEQSRVKSVQGFIEEQRAVGERLMSARPAMASVYNIVSRLLDIMYRQAEKASLDSIRHLTISEADKLIDGSLKAVAQIAEHASKLIVDGDVIMTHSYSSTVVAVLLNALGKRRNIEAVVTRSGVGRTGEKVAQALAEQGVPVTFIDDTAAGLYIKKCTRVVAGADRICADGTLVNAVGTYLLALSAKRVGIPFYVLCETLKFDSRLRGEQVDLEEKEPSEVIQPGVMPSQVRVKNPYFDITPADLITSVVTENGLLGIQEVVRFLK